MKRVLIAAALALFIVTTEFSARLYVVLHSPHIDVPPESNPEITQISERLTDDGYWVVNDFHGGFYNIDNGARRTAGQPTAYTHTLYLFGNSGTFDPYVPDHLTMASQLQARLVETGFQWRVVNLAVSGALSSDEALRLKHTPLQAGDIVIFIDGAMDNKTHEDCDTRLATWQLLCNAYWLAFPGTPDVTRYVRNGQQAQVYAQAHGAQFYRFVQPYSIAEAMAKWPGRHLIVPPQGFVEGSHLNARGDSLLAAQIFDALTSI